MINRYAELKRQNPDCLLLFRIGDFYEAFSGDAERLSCILRLTLSTRQSGGEVLAMAGFPHLALNANLMRLVTSGVRVAICESIPQGWDSVTA